MIYSTLFTASVFIFLFAIVKHLFALNAFLKRLESHHKETFVRLGSPKWRIQFGDPVFQSAVKWIKTREFESFNDEELQHSYSAMRRANTLGVVSAVVTFLTVLVPVILQG